MTMEIQVSNELDRRHANTDATIVKFKGKRTTRQRPPSPLALTMACSSSSDSEARTVVIAHHRLAANEDSDPATTATTTTAFATSRDSPEHTREEEEDMANCLILLARGRGPIDLKPAGDRNNDGVEASCTFSCKTCGRSFPSFQALGGHRASHKKPKLDNDDKNKQPVHVTMKDKDIDDKQASAAACTALSLQIMPGAAGGAATSSSGNKSSYKVHECSVCGAEFNSGQALGGHMRRHRPVMSGSGANNTAPEIKKVRHGQRLQGLDLNLPAPATDEEEEREAAAEYAFASKEEVLVFSTSTLALVGCHY